MHNFLIFSLVIIYSSLANSFEDPKKYKDIDLKYISVEVSDPKQKVGYTIGDLIKRKVNLTILKPFSLIEESLPIVGYEKRYRGELLGMTLRKSDFSKVITKEMIRTMKKGSVIVDVAIDQGGCVETSKPTTHANPTFIVDGVVHYCVANMPGGVPRTSTIALNKATLPFLKKLADQGYIKTLSENKNYLDGLNVYKGKITCKGVAEALNYKYFPLEKILTV